MAAQAHRQAVILGAGNVGRGFLGQLFCESGYRVTFVDVDRPLVDALRARGAYTLRLVDNEGREEVEVGPVTALHASQRADVAEAWATASLGATAVGVRALPQVAPLIAAGIARRAERGLGQPLNLIVCENLKGAAHALRELVSAHLDASGRAYLERWVGLVDTVIGRMVPELPPELRARDPSLIIAEPYKELPVDREGFVGSIPEVVGMQPCSDFALYTARKLYLHNMGHAVLAYLGYRRGHALGYEALADAPVRAALDAALDESLQGIAARFGADQRWLRDHVDDLLRRFANRALADPIARLARDPLRKLAPEDRLVGAARLAEGTGRTPTALALGIAAALAYDAADDAAARALQERLAADGPEKVLAEVSAVRADEPLGREVLARYARLREGLSWP